MVRSTATRLIPVVDFANQWVITGKDILEATRAALPELPTLQIIPEPMGRNTAPCVGLAAALLQADAERANIESPLCGIFPSDHFIGDLPAWHACLEAAYSAAAASESIITLGIRPTRPETGFGYIEAASALDATSPLAPLGVRRFVEKPNHATALEYLASGRFFWNAGIFVFRASTMLREIARQMPELSEGLKTLAAAWRTPEWSDVLAAVFPTLPSISIDYGVMERAQRVQVIPASFTWSDVGHWAALDEVTTPDARGNVALGDTLTIDAENCVLAQLSQSPSRIVVALGVQNTVIVDTEDAVLVCDRNQVQRVREVIERLRALGRLSLL